jgi:hypothetical protein
VGDRTVALRQQRRTTQTTPTLSINHGLMSAIVRSELRADASDVYNTRIKYLLVPFFVAYSAFALFGRAATAPHDADDAITTHIARDSGLRMQLTVEQLPTHLHRGHSVAAVLLCFVMVWQKQTVLNMNISLSGSSKGTSYADHLFWHRWAGRLGIGLVMLMDLCGLLMGPLSAWDNFTTFNLFFFAPWTFMIAGIYGCASSKGKLVCYHRFFGNMLLKGCIATPLARLAGAALQRQVTGPPLACLVSVSYCTCG